MRIAAVTAQHVVARALGGGVLEGASSIVVDQMHPPDDPILAIPELVSHPPWHLACKTCCDHEDQPMRLSAPPQGEDLLALLRNDHRCFLLWLAALADPDEDVTQRASMFEDLRLGLLAHGRAEAAVLEAVVAHDASLRRVLLADREERALIERLVEELHAQRPEGDVWLARVRTLLGLLRHHVVQQEAVVFPVLRAALGDDERQSLTDHFRTARRAFAPAQTERAGQRCRRRPRSERDLRARAPTAES